jgi:hypothetical protein
MTHQQIQVTVEDLEEENARLTALLEANGIEWRKSVRSKEKLEGVRGQNRLSIEQKLSCSSAFFGSPGFIPCAVAEQGKW